MAGGKVSGFYSFFSQSRYEHVCDRSGIQQLTLGLPLDTNANSLGGYQGYVSCGSLPQDAFKLREEGQQLQGNCENLCLTGKKL